MKPMAEVELYDWKLEINLADKSEEEIQRVLSVVEERLYLLLGRKVRIKASKSEQRRFALDPMSLIG
jgi:hypothetical protein